MVIQATVMLAIIGSFIQSRRVTESTVLHAAATSMVYGLIEQIKQLDYTTLLPNYEADPAEPSGLTPPYVRVRISQEKIVWLRVVHTAVHLTRNDVIARFSVYMASNLVLAGFWLLLLVRLVRYG